MTEVKEEVIQKVSKLLDADLLILEKIKNTNQMASFKAERAALENKIADLVHQNTILKIYLKYNLSDKDAIDENGNILYDHKAELTE